MKRIGKGPVRGISLKLQEEERERRMEYVPERSEVDVEVIQVDADTREMLKEMQMDTLPNLSTTNMGFGAMARRGASPRGVGRRRVCSAARTTRGHRTSKCAVS